MNENKIVAAILAIAVCAREPRTPSVEVGKENWRKVLQLYEKLLLALNEKKVGA